jgi:hypothetical protein
MRYVGAVILFLCVAAGCEGPDDSQRTPTSSTVALAPATPTLQEGLQAAEEWVRLQDGELIGECISRPGPPPVGPDPARHDWCYYPPDPQAAGDYVLPVGRPGYGYRLDLVMESRDHRGLSVIDARPPILPELQVTFFDDEHAIRWSGVLGAASYRVKGDLAANREHAGDSCAAPPLADERIEIDLDEVVSAETDAYLFSLPELPTEDAWWISVEDMVIVEALDETGAVIDSSGQTWVRDTFCVRPTAVTGP